MNELNSFYARFDVFNFKAECDNILFSLQGKNDPLIVLSEEEVLFSLKNIKMGKSSGPDNITASVLKACASQLQTPLRRLFQTSLDKGIVPTSWKLSQITPVPKVKFPREKNDTRPVCLTSLLMKSLEHIVKRALCQRFDEVRDVLQFAYCKGKSVQDAVLTVLHQVTDHLEKPKSSVRALYVDFSSAFNTIQIHLLLQKLLTLNVNSNLIRWIHNFMSNRPQYVKFKNTQSNVIITNSGAPQGCVLSPLLFSIYTNDCISLHENCSIVKYADDTVIIGKITDGNDDTFLTQVHEFVQWCDNNFLNLNVKKTKEMVFNFSRLRTEPMNITIKNETVERVNDYKYLGIVIDDRLSGSENTKFVMSKCMQRIYHLRILRNLNVERVILSMFYKSVVESVLCFSITVWYGALSRKDRKKLDKIIKCAGRTGAEVTSMEKLYHKKMRNMVDKMRASENHPLHECFKFLSHGKRLRMPRIRTTRFKNSFICKGIKLFNSMKN